MFDQSLLVHCILIITLAAEIGMHVCSQVTQVIIMQEEEEESEAQMLARLLVEWLSHPVPLPVFSLKSACLYANDLDLHHNKDLRACMQLCEDPNIPQAIRTALTYARPAIPLYPSPQRDPPPDCTDEEWMEWRSTEEAKAIQGTATKIEEWAACKGDRQLAVAFNAIREPERMADVIERWKERCRQKHAPAPAPPAQEEEQRIELEYYRAIMYDEAIANAEAFYPEEELETEGETTDDSLDTRIL